MSGQTDFLEIDKSALDIGIDQLYAHLLKLGTVIVIIVMHRVHVLLSISSQRFIAMMQSDGASGARR